jgi:hypothetical protein
MGTTYGQQAQIINQSQIGRTENNPFPPGWPSLGNTTFGTEPYWNDLIIVAPNTQFLAWAYPGAGNNLAQPLGSEPSFALTIPWLVACAGNSNISTHSGPSISGPENQYSFTNSDCAALLQLDPFYVAHTQNV